MTYTNPAQRHDFVLLFDVTNGNPNGDPDANNLPRIDPETGHGLVTDVALKRKIRDYVQLCLGKSIFVQSKTSLNSLISEGFRDIGVQPPQATLADPEVVEWFEQKTPDNFDLDDGVLSFGGEAASERDILNVLRESLDDTVEEENLLKKLQAVAGDLAKSAKQRRITREQRSHARERLCENYFDIRMFGAVLSTGLNAGQVRGPAQLSFARSVDPVFRIPATVTRQARTTAARMETGPTEMGRKPFIPYGLYRAHGFFNPYLAKQTGVTEDDLKAFWSALGNLFDNDRSAARPEMAVQGLDVFTHDNPMGNAPAHRLFQRIRVSRLEGIDAPRKFEDYVVQVDDDLPAGITLTRLVV